MTFRVAAAEVLGRRPHDVQVIQNADGTTTDCVLRSLMIARQRFGVEEVVVLHPGTVADLDVAQVARTAAKRIVQSLGDGVRVRAILHDARTQTNVELDVDQRAFN